MHKPTEKAPDDQILLTGLSLLADKFVLFRLAVHERSPAKRHLIKLDGTDSRLFLLPTLRVI